MTRKALRTRSRRAARPARRAGTRQRWVAVGALVAAATLAPRPAAAAPFGSLRRDPFDVSLAGRPALDRRLALVDAALFAASMSVPGRAAAGAPVPGPAAGGPGPRPDPQQAQVSRRTDIPAGPLSSVIPALEQLTGLRVMLALPSLGAIHSPGASGLLTPAQALAALLQGTGVRFRFTSAAEVLLDVDVQSESVEVTGRAPGATVQSPKYPAPLRNTPQTIEVIPQAAMAQQGVTTLSEALRNVPGITMQAGEGGGSSNTAGDMFNMRGFNAANSLFVDGVRDDGLVSRDVFNLEQVEVFMGPTGSDVGRGTAAGYVNMQTKTPHLPASLSGAVSYGSATQRRVTADVNHALTSAPDGGWWSRSAVRANVLWQDSGVPGRDVAELETRAFAPSIGVGLDTPTRVTAGAQFMRQDNAPDYGVPGAAWSEDLLTPTTVQTALPVDQSNYYGSRGYDYDHASQNNVVARVEHDLSPRVTIANQTRWNDTGREAVITSIASVAAYNPANDLVTLSRQGNDRQNSIASNQTSLAARFSTGGLQHAASAGVELTREKQFSPTLGGVGTRNPVNIYTPNPDDPVTAYAVIRTGAETRGRTSTVAAYAFDSIDLTRRWQLSGGARVEHYDTRYRAIDATGLVTTDESAADVLFSGKAGLLFKVTDRGSVYVSYGSTVTPPGGANFSLSSQENNQNNPDVKPQESTNLEAGSKWELAGGRLLLTGALFHTNNRNVIYTIDATAVPPLYNQDDGQRVNGVTLGANGEIREGWNVIANVSYLDTALETQNSVNNGNRLTLTPELSGGVWTTYRLPVRLTIGGGLRASDAVFVNAANTIRTPGYCLLDLLAEFVVTPHATLRLNVYNATNETYIRSVNNNGGRYNPGVPRAALLTLALGF